MARTPTHPCAICGKKFAISRMQQFDTLRLGIQQLMRKGHHEVHDTSLICENDASKYRRLYMEAMLEAEKGELSKIERDVIKSLVDHEIIANRLHQQYTRRRTFAEFMADKIAEFGGSWKFIITFGVIIFVWMYINVHMMTHAFDPYPFILLNLLLSCLAALQAPIIMMSQNRIAKKDRLRAEHDYKINLKSELQIRNLNDKIDNFTQQQWRRLLEIQQMQLELLESSKKR